MNTKKLFKNEISVSYLVVGGVTNYGIKNELPFSHFTVRLETNHGKIKHFD